MTFNDIMNDVRTWLQDEEFDFSTILMAANAFQNQLFMDHRIRFMEAEDEIYVGTGDTSAELPDDMQTLITLTQTTPQSIDLTPYYVEYKTFMAGFSNYAARSGGQLLHWTDFGNAMRFPVVLGDTVLHIDYLRRPAPMTDATSLCELPDAYKTLMEKGTLAMCMEINEDYSEAQTERANYAPLVTSFVRNEGRGQIKTGPIIMRTNRRGRRSDDLFGR